MKQEEENARKQAEEAEDQIGEECMQKILASPTEPPAVSVGAIPKNGDEEEKKEEDELMKLKIVKRSKTNLRPEKDTVSNNWRHHRGQKTRLYVYGALPRVPRNSSKV